MDEPIIKRIRLDNTGDNLDNIYKNQYFEKGLLLYRGVPIDAPYKLRTRDLPNAFAIFKELAIKYNHLNGIKWYAHCLRAGYGVDIDLKAGEKYISIAADMGDNYCIATRYTSAYKGEKNLEKAHEYIIKAYEEGDPCAMNAIGYNYNYGIGVIKNKSMAFSWFNKACEWGDISAINNLANMYRNGEGVNVDISKVITLYEEAISFGDSCAMCNMAEIYNNGKYGMVNLEKTLYYYKLSAQKKYSPAMNKLGDFYSIGTMKDDSLAFYWHQEAADLGDTNSMIALAKFYMIGIRGVSKNNEMMIKLLEKSANLGNKIAMHALGMIYIRNYQLNSPIFETGISLIRKAARMNYIPAISDLGWAYGIGYVGDEQHKDESAVYWFKKAMDLGVSTSYYNMAIYYEKGINVEKDLEQAQHYYHIAHTLGYNIREKINNLPIVGTLLDGFPVHMREKPTVSGNIVISDLIR